MLSYRPYEPSLSEDALRLTQTSLGHLIFRDHWERLRVSANIPVSEDAGKDALSLYFAECESALDVQSQGGI